MIMKIAVCDDCAEDIVRLRKMLGGHEVSSYHDADCLLADVEEKEKRYDLYLLDILIDESINGIELAEKIRRTQEDAVICFISTSDGFYREAYDVYAIQYLLKPLQEEQVQRLLAKVSKNLAVNREQKLSFQTRGQAGSISYKKILYISSMEHTISICCVDGSVFECKGKLGELAVRVCGNVFMRCHQSFLVNMYHVDSLKGMELTVGGVQIPISRRYYMEVKKRYQEILFEEVD